MTEEHRFGFRTRALHAGGTPDAATGARAVPIYQTTSFVFEDATDAGNLFALQKTATSTRVSATPPSLRSRNGWHRSRAGSVRSRQHPA